MFRHKGAICTLYNLTRDKPEASSGRDPFGPCIVTNVFIYKPENINNWNGVTEEAHYCTMLLLQQCKLFLLTCNAEF
jgi:hypothetical protein